MSRNNTYNAQGQATEIGTDFAPDVILDGRFSNASGKQKRQDRRRKKAAKAQEREAKRIARRKSGKTFFGGVWKTMKRFNPLSSTARLGTLAAFRLNLFGMATRMYPAFLSDQQITKRKFKKANAQRAKGQWSKVSEFWEKKLGGKPDNLKHAIVSGYDKPIFRRKKKKFSGVIGKGGYLNSPNYNEMNLGDRTNDIWEGMGWQYVDAIFEQIEGKDGKPCMEKARGLAREEKIFVSKALWADEEVMSGVTGVEESAVIAAALPVIAQIISMMNKGGLDKNPYEGGTEEAEDYTEDLNEATKEGEMNEPATDSAALDKIVKEGEQDAAKGGESDDDTIWGMPKPVVYIGGGIIGTTLLILGLRAIFTNK